MYNEKLCFRDKKFKIMQIADAQEIDFVNPDTVKLITLAAEKERPDLVVFTGDQIYGMFPTYFAGDTEKKVRKVISALVSPLERLGIPFAVTFGNHDLQCGISNADQADIYLESGFCVGGEYGSDDDKGTFNIPVYGENGETKLNVFLFDSNSQTATGEYLPVLTKQLDFFEKTLNRQKEENGSVSPVIVFQHIPVPEYYDVIKKVKKSEKGAVEAFRTHKNEFYVLPDEIKNAGGFMLESPATPDRNSGEFEVLKKNGVFALAVGHDHINSFAAEKDGVKLIYTQGSGFDVYGPGRNRGVRIFEFSEDNPCDFVTRTLTFDGLTSDRLSRPAAEFVLTHIPTSMEQVKRLAAFAGAGIVLTAGAAVCGIRMKKNGKK